MKHRVFKKISAVLVTTAVLFTTLFSVSIVVNAAPSATTFTPRLTAPDYSNKYYYDSDYNVFQKYGYGLPNCTAYAYGRAYEILGKEPKLSWNGASQWYGYNQSNNYYKYGQTPKVGAIACWSYGYGGHVAVVEKIDSNGNMTLSNSEWGGRTFYLTYAKTTDSNPGGNSWWTFQGYIYLIDSADVVETTVDHTSNYEPGTYQLTAAVNFRKSAGMDGSVIKTLNKGTVAVVTETYFNDDINWGKTVINGTTGWIALEYCNLIQDITEPETTVAPTTVPTQPTTTIPAGPITPDLEPTTVEDYTQAPVQGVLGDVNNDGRVSILDATVIQKFLASMMDLTETQAVLGDFDGDGRVTISDVTAIQVYLSDRS